MARRCSISGKRVRSGHNVSHANNKTKRVFRPNLQTKKLFVPELGKSVRVKLSTSMLRTIDKLGLAGALKNHGMTVKDLQA